MDGLKQNNNSDPQKEIIDRAIKICHDEFKVEFNELNPDERTECISRATWACGY